MTNHIIEFCTLESIKESGMQSLLNRGVESGVADSQFFRILAHSPGYAESLFDALYRSLMDGDVDHNLKEIIRISLSRQAEDTYFSTLRSKKAQENGLTEERINAGCGDFLSDNNFSEAEKWALTYCHSMYTRPETINTDFYAEGKKYYSEAQIMELGSLIAFHYGMQMFFSTLKLTPEL